MEFFSPRFAVFFLVLVGVLPLIGSGSARRHWLTLGSCLFYAAWDWRYLGLLLAISGIDFVAAARIEAAGDRQQARVWLLFSICSNLIILGYFKYANFFLDGLRSAGWSQQAPLEIALPAGISFYTFKTLSYTLDVYRGQLKACRSWSDYALFVSFFPDLIAGPIVRASQFLPQLARVPTLSGRRWVEGLNLFLQGLTKKILIADRLGEVADPVFAHPQVFSSQAAWMAAVAYAVQVYCDFSGYSDMAIGTARILGYDLPQNFALPYASRNLTELWQRWHITLTSWLRDYCYIPLGGSRVSLGKTCQNLIVVTTLAGLWHGASLHFLVWGLLQGVALAWLFWARRRGLPALPGPLAWFLTMTFWVVAGVFFRATSLDIARTMLTRMGGQPSAWGQHIPTHWFWTCLALVGLGHAIHSMVRKAPPRWMSWLGLEAVELPLAGRYLCFVEATGSGSFLMTMWLGLLLMCCATRATPFLYFQF